jgi:hypothetical protein
MKRFTARAGRVDVDRQKHMVECRVFFIVKFSSIFFWAGVVVVVDR